MKHPMRVTTCVLGLAAALLICGGCDQHPPGHGGQHKQTPATPPDGRAEQNSGANADTHLPSDRILEMLGVDLARIDLAEPTAISIFAEFGEERRTLLDGPGPVHDGALQIAVLVDSDPDRIRIAVASAEGNATMVTLKENPFRQTGSAFHPTPSDDGEGQYTIMSSSPPDATHKIVIVTRPATPE